MFGSSSIVRTSVAYVGRCLPGDWQSFPAGSCSLWILGILFATTLCSCTKQQSAPSRGVRGAIRTTAGLLCLEPDWNFGEVTVKGSAVQMTHVFLVRNDSSDVLRLRKIESTCGCLVAQDYKSSLRPGEATPITATISLALPPGRIRNELSIVDESAPNQPLTLRVFGSVGGSSSLFSTVDPLPLGTVPKGGRTRATMTIARYDGTPVNLTRCTPGTPAITLVGKPIATVREAFGQRQHVVEVPLEFDSSMLEPGAFASAIEILSAHDDPECTQCNVRVRGVVVPPKSEWRESIFIPCISPGEKLRIELTLRDTTDALMSVAVANSDNAYPSAKVEVTRIPGETAVYFSLLGPAPNSTILVAGTLAATVKTASGGTRHLRIPFTAIAAAP